MDDLIDPNENSRRRFGVEHTGKVEHNNNKSNNNNNNNDHDVEVPVFMSVVAPSPPFPSSGMMTSTTTTTTTSTPIASTPLLVSASPDTTTTNGDCGTSAPKSIPLCLSFNGHLSYMEHDDVDDGTGSPLSRQQSEEGLAFHNDGLIEEIFQLPSDDESSDDCVYAYRGANFEPPEPAQAHSADDETDFLEMDFDPEPNSEVENFNDEHFNHLEANFFSLQQNLNQFHDVPISKGVDQPEIHPSSCKETGTKPKQRTSSGTSVPVTSSLADNRDDATTAAANTTTTPATMVLRPEDDPSCLECAEAEFLRQTKPELSTEVRCAVHRRVTAAVREQQQYQQRQSTSNGVDIEALPTVHPHSRQLATCTEDNTGTRSFMVTIYSVGCDYDTIVEAINSIGVAANTEIIRQYFDAVLDEETATMSVPEYLLYISKRGCNYKKLMELIRAACLEPLDIHFYPIDPLAHTPEVVQVEAMEITSRWNPNTDLRQILRFKNKNFRYMNVLGKVAHVIRQADRNRQQYQSTINIPQYYKSGYICITRSRPWT